MCVLAVIKNGPSYGYKIINELKEYIDIAESTLYPILRRLETNGNLITYSQQTGGRIRKYYKITASGIARIARFVDDWQELIKIYQFIKEHGGYN
mgnify:CR=1 FL=1